ncbi:MAG: guanylate kinase [Bacteroidales bacterium]
MDKERGKVIIFSAPSGSGKTTIIKRLLAAGLPLSFSVSACTRLPRNGEVNGKDYYFLTEAVFREKLTNGEFLEWEEVYSGNLYGTLASEPERIWANQKHVLFDVDVKGGLRLKELFGYKALSLFIMPPSIEELRIRLQIRSTDSPEVIEKRIERAAYEMSFAPRFDSVVVNDQLDIATGVAYDKILNFLRE